MTEHVRRVKAALIVAASVCVAAILLLLVADRSARRTRGSVPPPKGPFEEVSQPPPIRIAPSTEGLDPPNLPDAYVGKVSIRGHALYENKRAASDAIVLCIPERFAPYEARHFEALSTRSRVDGSFELTNLPMAPTYTLQGIAGSHVGTLEVDYAATAGERIELVLGTLYYARFEFVDRAERPVVVQGQFVPITDGVIVLQSNSPLRQDLHTWLLATLGIDFDDVPENTIGALYSSKMRIVLMGMSDGFQLTLPGYEPALLPHTRFALSEWPKATRITLTKGPRTTLYRVEFPQLQWPAGWGQEDLTLQVTKSGSDVAWPLTRELNAFHLTSSQEFSLSQPGFGTLEYDVVSVNDQHVVRPRYPDYGYVTVNYGAGIPSGTRYYWITAQRMTGGATEGRIVWPGRARFGPLPVGRYRFAIYEGRVRGVKEPLTSFGPVEVLAGHHVYDWR